MKACGKHKINKYNYRISISGVPYHMIKSKLLIYDGLIFNNRRINIVDDRVNNKVYVERQGCGKEADWIIDYAFNECKKFKFTDFNTMKIFSHYNDYFQWEESKQNTLIINGQLSHVAFDGAPSQKLE